MILSVSEPLLASGAVGPPPWDSVLVGADVSFSSPVVAQPNTVVRNIRHRMRRQSIFFMKASFLMFFIQTSVPLRLADQAVLPLSRFRSPVGWGKEGEGSATDIGHMHSLKRQFDVVSKNML